MAHFLSFWFASHSFCCLLLVPLMPYGPICFFLVPALQAISMMPLGITHHI